MVIAQSATHRTGSAREAVQLECTRVSRSLSQWHPRVSAILERLAIGTCPAMVRHTRPAESYSVSLTETSVPALERVAGGE
jgi:hypothetical protein